MFDLAREIGQTISNNKLRTALTGLAVAWGIFMLIVLLGAARGVVNAFNDNMGASQTNKIQIWDGETSLPYKGYKDGRWIRLHDSDIDALMRDAGNVDKVSVQASASGTISGPKDYASGGFNAVYPAAKTSERLEMVKGRFINEQDIRELRRVMVLSEDNANLLFGSVDEALGNEAKVAGLAWKVVGVYSHRWRSTSYVPYTTYKAITGSDGYLDQMTVMVKDVTNEKEAVEAEKDIRSVLARKHEFDPADDNAVWIWNSMESYFKNLSALGYLNLAVWVIGILTLLTGIVGVSNIMFVSVRERKHEIGIRRAIGAKPRNIITQVLAESVAITTLFGYIGIVLGMAVLQVLNLFVGESDGFKNPTVDISIAVEVTVALIIAGAIAGLFPALKATKVKPVEALRDE